MFILFYEIDYMTLGICFSENVYDIDRGYTDNLTYPDDNETDDATP